MKRGITGNSELRDPGRPICLLHVFPSFEVGGSQMRFAELARKLGPGYRHKVISLNGRWDAMSLLEDVAEVEPVREGEPNARGVAGIMALRARIRQLQADLLVTYNWGAVEYALANAVFPVCPHVDIEDGFGPEEAEKRLFRRNLARWVAYSRAAALVVPSRQLERIAGREWKISASTIRYLPNGIDCARFEQPYDAALVSGLGLGEWKRAPVIGTIAGLRREKNIGRLIDAFSILRQNQEAQLLIVGAGPEREALEARARETGLGADIRFTGRIQAPEKIVGYFDIFALSSNTEQMPLSVLEAMAARKPVVSVRVGDIESMVCESNVRYLTDLSADALAQGLAQVLADPAALRNLVEDNHRRVRAVFDLDCMVAAYDDLFQAVSAVSK